MPICSYNYFTTLCFFLFKIWEIKWATLQVRRMYCIGLSERLLDANGLPRLPVFRGRVNRYGCLLPSSKSGWKSDAILKRWPTVRAVLKSEKEWLWKMTKPAIISQALLPRHAKTRKLDGDSGCNKQRLKAKRREPHEQWESRWCSPILFYGKRRYKKGRPGLSFSSLTLSSVSILFLSDPPPLRYLLRWPAAVTSRRLISIIIAVPSAPANKKGTKLTVFGCRVANVFKAVFFALKNAFLS